MNNKVLVEIIVPSIEERYDMYIPINKRIGKIIEQITKTINDMTDNSLGDSKLVFYNKETKEKYKMNDLVYYTNIRNGTSLILL